MIIIRAPATMNQPALAFQLLSCLQFVLFHLGSFRTGPSPWGTPNHRHPFLRGKTVAHLGYHYHATKDGDGVEQTIPKKHGMNLENTRHQMIYLYFHDEIRVLVT
jgi:hypothetical protein